MRVAPLGAYFADDLQQLILQARYSAEPTHAHPEGQAGAIAIALAAAWAWNHRSAERADGREMIEFAAAHTPEGDTQSRLRRALDIPLTREPALVGQMIGNGSLVTSPATVPFAIWCAARHCWDFSEALWATVSGFGRRRLRYELRDGGWDCRTLRRSRGDPSRLAGSARTLRL